MRLFKFVFHTGKHKSRWNDNNARGSLEFLSDRELSPGYSKTLKDLQSPGPYFQGKATLLSGAAEALLYWKHALEMKTTGPMEPVG